MRIDTTELRAISLILGGRSGITDVRIYMGKDGSGNIVGVVVGVDSRGKDMYKGGVIYKTSSSHSGLCPLICDADSYINKQ